MVAYRLADSAVLSCFIRSGFVNVSFVQPIQITLERLVRIIDVSWSFRKLLIECTSFLHRSKSRRCLLVLIMMNSALENSIEEYESNNDYSDASQTLRTHNTGMMLIWKIDI